MTSRSPALSAGGNVSSDTDGFFIAGYPGQPGPVGTAGITSSVDRFPFSVTPATSTSVGNISVAQGVSGGNSDISNGVGYQTIGSLSTDNLESFPYSSPFTTGTDVGLITGTNVNRANSQAMQSSSDGYLSTLNTAGAGDGNIQSFPFSSPFTTTTQLGDLVADVFLAGAAYSSTDGYMMGGRTGGNIARNDIQSFPFASPFTITTDVGNLTLSVNLSSGGSSSDDDGYMAGGITSTVVTDRIDRFPFNSPFTTATDVGNLSVGMYRNVGFQS